MSTCRHCRLPCYLADQQDHPCCVLWARLEPGQPCRGCAESRDYWRKNAWRSR